MWLCTHLSSISEKGWFFVVQSDCLGVEVDSGGIVARGKGLVALVLEINGFLRHCDAAAEGGGRGKRAEAERIELV